MRGVVGPANVPRIKIGPPFPDRDSIERVGPVPTGNLANVLQVPPACACLDNPPVTKCSVGGHSGSRAVSAAATAFQRAVLHLCPDLGKRARLRLLTPCSPQNYRDVAMRSGNVYLRYLLSIVNGDGG